MNTILQTEIFAAWLRGLKGGPARAAILARMNRAMQGNFGDRKSVGEGVSEMRVNTGPGYRIYYMRRGETVYLLLCGGTKGTQDRDIAQAKELAKAIKEQE